MTEGAGWRGILRQAGRFALLAVPKAGGGVFLVALNLVLVSVLGADDYGRFAYAMTLVLLADAVIGAPFDLAVIKLAGEAKSDDGPPLGPARAALHVKLASFLVLAVGAGIGLHLAGPLAGQGWIVATLVLGVLSMLLVRSVQVTLQVSGHFLAYAAVETVQLGLRVAAIAAVVLLLTPGAALALAALAAGAFAAAAWGGLAVQKGLFATGNRGALPYAGVVAVAGWYLATTAVGALIGRLDVLALGWLATAERIGLFTAGQVIASIAELGGSYLAVFLTPMLVAAMRTGSIASLYRRVQPALIGLALLGLVAAHLIAPLLFPLLLPAAYQRSGEVALILLPGTLAAFATVPLALPLVLFRHKRALLALDIVLLPFVALAYVLAIRAHAEIGAAHVTAVVMLVRSAFVQGVALWSLRRPLAAEHE